MGMVGSAYSEVYNAGFEGGIHKNEIDYKKAKEYKEVIFFTGEPIVLKGTVKIKSTDKKLNYEYELVSEDGKVELEREIDLNRTIDHDDISRQIVEVNDVIDFDEEIIIEDGDNTTTYTLTKYVLHNSAVDDKQPVVGYYAGNWLGDKTYDINDGEGKVTVNITGDIYGYDHSWGATETQKIHEDISFERKVDDDIIEWYGYADIDLSFNRTRKMEYFDNLPYQTSFGDGYTLTEGEETIMKYNYNLPRIKNGKVTNRKNNGSGVERFETLPTQQKLFIPRYQDIKGHWAEWDIKRLAGLKVIDNNKKYFGPELKMKRSDFARWVALATNLYQEDEKPKRSYTKSEANPQIFNDVTTEDPDYKYIKVINERGIMNGVGDNRFMPDGELTRAHAITIVIRAIGLERLAPNPSFDTRFEDDKRIPSWAKKAIYVADQIGIATGTPDGYIYPNESMTRAEAAAFINRFITYLQENLKEDYREGLINY